MSFLMKLDYSMKVRVIGKNKDMIHCEHGMGSSLSLSFFA